ncbi:MAG TPA: hypothetical protein VIL97_10940, partial [Thermoanaerobaculia bacterium]
MGHLIDLFAAEKLAALGLLLEQTEMARSHNDLIEIEHRRRGLAKRFFDAFVRGSRHDNELSAGTLADLQRMRGQELIEDASRVGCSRLSSDLHLGTNDGAAVDDGQTALPEVVESFAE